MESGKYLVKKGDPTAWESISRLGHMIQGLPDALFDEVKTGEYIFSCHGDKMTYTCTCSMCLNFPSLSLCFIDKYLV